MEAPVFYLQLPAAMQPIEPVTARAFDQKISALQAQLKVWDVNFAAVRTALFFRKCTTAQEVMQKLAALSEALADKEDFYANALAAGSLEEIPQRIERAKSVEIQRYRNLSLLTPIWEDQEKFSRLEQASRLIGRCVASKDLEEVLTDITEGKFPPEEKRELLRVLHCAYKQQGAEPISAIVEQQVDSIPQKIPKRVSWEVAQAPLVPIAPSSDSEFQFSSYATKGLFTWTAPSTYQHGLTMQKEVGELVAGLKASLTSSIERIQQGEVEDIDCYVRHVVDLQGRLTTKYEEIFSLPLDSHTKALLGYVNGLEASLEHSIALLEVAHLLLQPPAQTAFKLQKAVQACIVSNEPIAYFDAGQHITQLAAVKPLANYVEALKRIYLRCAYRHFAISEQEKELIDAILKQKMLQDMQAVQNLLVKRITHALFFTPKRIDRELEVMLYSVNPKTAAVDAYDKVYSQQRNMALLEEALQVLARTEKTDLVLSDDFHTKTLQEIVDAFSPHSSDVDLLRVLSAALFAAGDQDKQLARGHLNKILEDSTYTERMNGLSEELKLLLYIFTAEKIYKYQETPGKKEFTFFLEGLKLYLVNEKLPFAYYPLALAFFCLIRREQLDGDGKYAGYADYFRDHTGDALFEEWYGHFSMLLASDKVARASLLLRDNERIQQEIKDVELYRGSADL